MLCTFLNTYVSDLLVSRHTRLCFSICPGLNTAAHATSRVHPWGCTSWLLYAGGSISIYFWTHTHISPYKNYKTKWSSNSNYEKSECKQGLIKLSTKTHIDFSFKILIFIVYASENTKCCKMGLLVYFRKENPESVPELLDRKNIQALISWLDSPQACNLNCFSSQRVSPIQRILYWSRILLMLAEAGGLCISYHTLKCHVPPK